MFVGPSMRTIGPDSSQFYEKSVIAFQVVDCPGGDTARGDYPGMMPGVVRPLLEWNTEVLAAALEPVGVGVRQ
jgi:lipopolysaccharide transport system ATP-binding protein